MQLIKIDELKPHEQNGYFFDDIQGDNWSEFLKSVQTSGVIEPVIITQNKVIVSGHQRVRACKELSVMEVPCEIRIYDTEDKILKDLLETNLRQRGVGNTNPIKLGRCIVELENIYGVRKGSLGITSHVDNPHQVTQKDIAENVGVSQDQAKGYKKLLTLIPELQDSIESGILSPTVGYKVLSRLPKEEQEKLISDFGADYISSLTQKKAQELISGLKQEKENLEIQLQQALNKSAVKGDLEALAKDTKETDTVSDDLTELADIENTVSPLENLPTPIEELKPTDDATDTVDGESIIAELQLNVSEFVKVMSKHISMEDLYEEFSKADKNKVRETIEDVEKVINKIKNFLS